MKLAKKEGGARPWANTWRRANTKDQPAASVPSGRQAMASWPPELLQRRLTTMAVSRHQAASTYYSLVAPSYRGHQNSSTSRGKYPAAPNYNRQSEILRPTNIEGFHVVLGIIKQYTKDNGYLSSEFMAASRR